jgi:hypothetical protein
MKLRIGDKVRFLNEKGEGVVTRFKDKHTVFVELPDGFEIPFPAKQLVPVHTELIINPDVENIDINLESSVTDAIYFVIEPDHEMPILANDYSIYLFNSSSYSLLYTYAIKDDQYFQALKHGEVGAYQKVLLKQVKMNFFKEYNYHKVECLLLKNIHFRSQIPIAEIIYISPQNLNQSSLIKHDEFKNPVYAFLLKDEFIVAQNVEQNLSEEDITRLKTIKEFKSSAKRSKSAKEQQKKLEKEVDLHIEELVDKVVGLTNHEMLSIQLERFEKELDAAMAGGLKKIIFIHGVGNGRLKHEIQRILKDIRGVSFQDAPYKLYGFGATQVNIH